MRVSYAPGKDLIKSIVVCNSKSILFPICSVLCEPLAQNEREPHRSIYHPQIG